MINAAGGRDGSHTALLYRDVEELTDVFAALAEAGARGNQPVLLAATKPILDRLRPKLPDHGSAIRLVDLTSRGTDPGRVLATVRQFAAEHRGRSVSCLQEVGWPGRRAEELTEATRYDALIGTAFADSAAHVVCGYQMQIDVCCLARARRSHPIVIQDGRVHASVTTDSTLVGRVPADALSNPPSRAATLTFRGDQARVRKFAADGARRAGMPADRITDLQIAVGELAANTLVHTSGPGTLTIWTEDDEVVCQVSDTGHIIDPLAGTVRPDPASLGSKRGLWLVHQVSDLVQIRTASSGTTVRVHLRLAAG